MYDRGHPTSRSHPNPSRKWFLDQICPIPDPMRTHEEWERYEHRDLPGFTRAEMLVELDRVKERLRLDDHPDRWLFERHAALSEGAKRAS